MNFRNMEIWNKNKSNEIAQIYGTLIAVGLILYFFLMYAVGLIHVVELRLLNLLIMLAGVYFAMKQFRRTHEGQMNYFRALSLGTAVATIGTSTFALVLFFFLKFEGSLMESIQQNEPLGIHLNPYMASFVVMLEGVFSGFGLSYLLVNYIETDKATEPQGGELRVTNK